jgi:hypothetical protein
VARKSTDIVKLQLRLPEALRRRLERAAKASDVSMNAVIVHKLENSFRMDDLNEQIKAAVGEGFKEAMMAPLGEIGKFTTVERIERWAKRLAGIDPDASEPDQQNADDRPRRAG